ncbi:MAG: hypothetical protein ACK5RV_12650 [Flavobacterium sp.]|jgi:hypothetical protein|uniref:hypothetical protein n=1 Tax=Flavobacterium sp. TaxID=239 RepID=UPI0022CBE6BC|nr:hypothetical protein [Flavobacterium sp.]MCZ8297695.1 hypothetical protein [Flavobacterium sp.]
MKNFIFLQTMNTSTEKLLTPIIIYIVLFVVAVYITRWIFGIDKIIENQNKTNSLLQELINKTTCSEHVKKNTITNTNPGDVNNPEALNDIIDKLK